MLYARSFENSQAHLQALYYGSASTPLVCAIPSTSLPGMWWLLWPDGRISDLGNLVRVKDAAVICCERGPPARDRLRLHWKINPSNSPSEARRRVSRTDPVSAPAPSSVRRPPLSPKTVHNGQALRLNGGGS
jgi:hypothetical protein